VVLQNALRVQLLHGEWVDKSVKELGCTLDGWPPVSTVQQLQMIKEKIHYHIEQAMLLDCPLMGMMPQPQVKKEKLRYHIEQAMLLDCPLVGMMLQLQIMKEYVQYHLGQAMRLDSLLRPLGSKHFLVCHGLHVNVLCKETASVYRQFLTRVFSLALGRFPDLLACCWSYTQIASLLRVARFGDELACLLTDSLEWPSAPHSTSLVNRTQRCHSLSLFGPQQDKVDSPQATQKLQL